MQYNGIKAKSFKMQDGGTLVELRYDATNNKINGVYISKDNGTTFKKLLDEDEVSTRINNFIATIQSGLSTPISINLESALPNISNAVAWSSVSGVSTSTTYSAGDKLAKDGVMYEVINTVSIKDDGSDDPQTFLNSGDMKVFVKDGTYYSIQNMDITKPGHTGRAWYNSNASVNTWQTSYDDTGRPIMEYDDITVGEQIAEDSTITKDKVFYRALQDVTCSGNWATDKSKFEELKTSGAILNQFEANRYYSENEMIIEDNVIYTRKTAGTSGATLGADIANWEPQTRLHTSGSRHVEFKISTATYPSASSWATQNLVYVDGDQSMIGTNTLIAPVDGLYYAHIFPFTVLPKAGSSIIRLVDSTTSAVYTANVSGALGAANYESQGGFDTILHLSKGDKLQVEIYSTVKPTTSSSIPCEFGLIAEDQSDNLVCEAQIVNYTSLTTSETNMKLQDISNPSVLSSTGMITLPEDGSYFVNIDFMQSAAGGSQGTATTFVSNSTKTTRYIISKNNDMTNGQIQSLSGILTGSKGEQFQISHSKTVAQSGLTYPSNYKRYARIFKLKSVEHKLEPVDLYNEYINRVPSGMTPMSYDSWVKSIVQRNQYRVEAKSIAVGLVVNAWTNIPSQYSSGVQSMLDDNKFIAPVAGLYYFTLNSALNTTGVKSVNCTLIEKNGSKRITYLETNNSTTNFSGATTVIWLDKDEYLQPRVLSRTADTYPASIIMEFGLIQGGHPLENYPNTWEPNVEYDFGNGLYGQRFTGSVTHTATHTTQDVVLTSTIPDSLISSGGKWNRGSTYWTLSIGQTTPLAISTNGDIDLLSAIAIDHTRGLLVRFYNNVAQTSTYDIWVKYTK